MKRIHHFLILSIIFLCFSACKKEQEPCSVTNLMVTTGTCDNDGAYAITLDFDYTNPENSFYDIYLRDNDYYGLFRYDELPLTINDFKPSGLEYDFIRVCIDERPDCCLEIEFTPPTCITDSNPCAVSNLQAAVVNNCNPDGTYNLSIDFDVENAGNEFFDLYVRDDVLLGFYSLDSLPLELNNFMPSGFDYDYLKVCVNDDPNCCQEVEFMGPDCPTDSCEISNLILDPGNCTSATTYDLYLDFDVVNPGNEYFEVFTRNDSLFGYYLLSDLPMSLPDFEISGFNYDYIKVCINDVPECCIEMEFMPPNC